MSDTIFTVKETHLSRLSPEDSVMFFRDLLWAEARRIGIPFTEMNISHWITVPDGGIDAEVNSGSHRGDGGLIKAGYTGYQIKAGDSFKPWQEAAVKKELFGDKPQSRENLGKAVKDCLKKQGRYVLVCTGIDPTGLEVADAVSHLKKYFKLCGYAPDVEVLGQNRLLAFLGSFPSLSLRLNGNDKAQFLSHAAWSGQNEMRKPFKPGERQTAFISALQQNLRKESESAIHLHVRGEPGIGKTRLVLEATRAKDLTPAIVYCAAASKFRDSYLMNQILRDDNPFAVIVVIDECDLNDRRYVWNNLATRGRRIKLVTIYNEFEDDSGTTIYMDVPPLDDAHISAIIQSYDIPKDQADRWPPQCGGSPRVAHVIGLNLHNNPEDLLKSPDTVSIWDRFICSGDTVDSPSVRDRRIVLQYLSLFKRFGFARSVAAEAKLIARRIEAAAPQITQAVFEGIVVQIKNRKILQGENTLYITPKLLHIKLWVDWWEEHGPLFDLEEFNKDLPDELVGWFNEMFEYAKESKAATKTVQNLLGPDGPFQKKSNFIDTPRGSRFFLAMAEAEPRSALRCLEKTVGAWSKEDLHNFSTGRRNVIWALEKIAMWRDLFPGACRLLLALAEAENENFSNNASGVFAGLFTLGMGKMAPTEAPPEERFPILEEAFRSSSKERRALALKACDSALTTYLHRAVGAEYQGLREVKQRWMPKTYGELYAAYDQAWQFLHQQMTQLPDDERKQAAKILIQHARGLVGISSLADLIIETLFDLANDASNREELLTSIVQLLHYEGKVLPDAIRLRLEQLKQSLTGSDFSSLLRRYVGMNLWEDEFDEEGNRTNQLEDRIANLAKQAFEQPESLQSELHWLMSTAAINGYSFGHELGKQDRQFQLLRVLLEKQKETGKEGGAFLLGGYFRAMFEKDRAKWDHEMDTLAKDSQMVTWVPELTWRSGLTDAAAERILELAKKGSITISHFRMFCLASALQRLSEEMFKKWIDYLMASSDENAPGIALDMYDYFYLRQKTENAMPENLTFRLLTHDLLLRDKEPETMVDYHWTEVAKAFVNLYPLRSVDLAARVFEVEDGGFFEGYRGTAKSVLTDIARAQPKEIWQLVARYLGPPFDRRSYFLMTWLKGEEHIFEENHAPGVMAVIPASDVWVWVDEDKASRAPFLAHYVPKHPFAATNQVCPRQILVRYGEMSEVLSALTANFYTEGWSGPRSLHYQRRKNELLQYRHGETNPNVIRWIDEQIEALDRQIEFANIEEEKRL